MDGEETIDVDLSADDQIRLDMIEVVDLLKVEMSDRFEKINLISCKFGFLYCLFCWTQQMIILLMKRSMPSLHCMVTMK